MMYRAFGGLHIYKDDQGVRHTVGCPNLNQSILIPNSVTFMASCFDNCNNLYRKLELENESQSTIAVPNTLNNKC